MPKIEIDEIVVEADAGSSIIEVADRLSIHIPRFCYHNKLSVAANCRMCLVQVEKSPKALPSCATPIVEGMKVWTKSKETIAAQRAVMEFLLINHPLDCPVCDQGGECELQDVSMMYGRSDSRYTETKRAVLSHDIGPLVATEMTRCIQCTRCVRFGSEIAGERELGAIGRGEHMEISTFIERQIHSEVSGNIIDLCPVGALTSKPYRFKARPWELRAFATISPHDNIGSNLYLHIHNQMVMRVVPKPNEKLNEVWLSDRDRFSYEALQHDERIRKPLININDKWHTAAWDEALNFAINGLNLAIDAYGADNMAVLVSPSLSTEEYYLLQQITRELGCNNIDHRLRQLDFTHDNLSPIYPTLGIDFEQLAEQNLVFLIGANIAKEQPLASIRLRKMVKKGGRICAINPVDFTYNFAVANKIVVPAHELLQTLASIAKELLILTNYKVPDKTLSALSKITISADAKNIANALLVSGKKQIILGHLAIMHPQAGQLFALTNLIAEMIGATYGYFAEGANPSGAWLAGCVPHRLPGGAQASNVGRNASQMLQTASKVYILYAIEPEFDSIFGNIAIQTLRQADFIIAISSFQSDTLLEIADVILPLAQFTEYAGSMININGETQHYNAVVPMFGDSLPGWQILTEFAKRLELPTCIYADLDTLKVAIEQQIIPKANLDISYKALSISPLEPVANTNLVRLAPIALYAIDALVRRAKSLQCTKDACLDPEIIINADTAQHLNVAHNEMVRVGILGDDNVKPVILRVIVDATIANYTAIIYQANNHTLSLGAPYTKIEVRKC